KNPVGGAALELYQRCCRCISHHVEFARQYQVDLRITRRDVTENGASDSGPAEEEVVDSAQLGELTGFPANKAIRPVANWCASVCRSGERIGWNCGQQVR